MLYSIDAITTCVKYKDKSTDKTFIFSNFIYYAICLLIN